MDILVARIGCFVICLSFLDQELVDYLFMHLLFSSSYCISHLNHGSFMTKLSIEMTSLVI